MMVFNFERKKIQIEKSEAENFYKVHQTKRHFIMIFVAIFHLAQ